MVVSMSEQACRVGASNRQTRMLAGLHTTGVIDPTISDDNLLERAVVNLERMAFVGITERFEDSMLLLKQTFPGPLARFNKYVRFRCDFARLLKTQVTHVTFLQPTSTPPPLLMFK